MRRLLVTALCLIPLAAAGCGSGGSSDGGKSPLDNALGYMPKSAPIVFSIDTDLNGSQWQSLTTNVKKFPFAGQIDSSLKREVGQSGLDFDKDIKPLLGNQFVVSLPTVQTVLSGNSEAVGAIQVKDKGKLSDVLSSSKDLTKDGSSNGATFYKGSDGSTEVGQKDDVFLVADTKQQLVAAVQQRDRDDRLTQDGFNSNLSGLSSDALVRGYVDAGSLLSGSPEAATTRKVKWVAALRTAGFTVSSKPDGLAIDFDVKTDPSQLTDADLPIASGDASPPVATNAGDFGAGIRGLDQTVRFAESVSQVVNPASYANFVRAKKQLSSRLGFDVDKDLIGQLSGNTAISSDIGGHFAVRVEPKDPATFARSLEKFEKVAPQFARGAGLSGAKLTRVGNLYKLTGASGKTIYYGMVGKVFALSNNPAQLARIASATPQPVPGAKGAVAINSDIGKLVAEIISNAAGGGLGGGLGGALVTAPLGNLTGWASSSTSGITGHYQLAIK